MEALRESVSSGKNESAQLTNELSELKNQVEAQKGRVDTAIAEFQSQFSKAEDRRRQEAENAAKERAQAAEDAQKERDAEVKRTIEQLDARASQVVADLEAKRSEAFDLVQVISNVGVTGNFKEEANAERRSADTFRWIALGSMALIVVGITATLWKLMQADSAWQDVAIRIGITIALAIPAAYAARESERHRVLERRYRRTELELSSIDTYLQDLPEDTRNELRAKLTEKFFGQPDESPPDKEAAQVATSALDIIEMAMANLTKR